MVIRGALEHCFDVLTAFEHYPEWAADIKAVSVDARDDQGRATRVTFRAAAFGRSTSYTLLYDYADAPRTLSWVQVDGDITRRLDGSYELVAEPDGSTEITYHLTAALKELLARVEGEGQPARDRA